MGLKKRISTLLICGIIILGNISTVYADGANVVTLGTNLSSEQKQIVLDYFGVKENEVVILEVNNQEERKYLEGVATEAQLGTRTYSCAYVQPTSKGNGLNVKTVNLTYVTSSMIASTLTTCGITDANVIAMTPISGGVSGTGALTGIMKAFEDSTGKPLEEEKKEFLESLGLEQSGLDKLIKSSYSLLGLMSYLTAGVQEVRAWTIKVGTKAPAAGGKIHSDIERGFIRAETIAFNDLVQVGTMTAAKEKGLVRLEGKEYIVKDGDVILFRFNV